MREKNNKNSFYRYLSKEIIKLEREGKDFRGCDFRAGRYPFYTLLSEDRIMAYYKAVSHALYDSLLSELESNNKCCITLDECVRDLYCNDRLYYNDDYLTLPSGFTLHTIGIYATISNLYGKMFIKSHNRICACLTREFVQRMVVDAIITIMSSRENNPNAA